MGAGWTCVVVSEGGNVELEQLDDAGREWCATGPGGEHLGGVREALEAALGAPADPAWLGLVVATVERDRVSQRRSMLVVKRGLGTWFHATFSANRESISRHGLDWTRMTGSGIAGSRRPEAEGVFLCADLESAEWFAQMGTRHGQAVDIWAVRLDGTWLIGDPGASGGGDDVWMIAPSRSGRADSGSRAENFAARDRPVRESRPPRGSLVPRYHHVRSEPSDEIEKHSADRRAEQEGN